MEQTVLTPHQQKAIELIASEKRLGDFYLSGGTALAAYYLQHRFSDDLDFFVFENPDLIFLKSFAEKIKEEIGAKDIRFERLYDRNQFFFETSTGELKVEFTKYPFRQLENTTLKDGIKIDSLRDLAANKLMAMLDRFDPKDFADLFFILQNKNIGDIKLDVETKFEMKIDNIFLGGELAKVKRIEALPKMIRPLTINHIRTFFAEKASELASEIIRN